MTREHSRSDQPMAGHEPSESASADGLRPPMASADAPPAEPVRSPGAGEDPTRVAVISLHTSPSDQPGMGDSGGMNVYIREVAQRLAEQGVAVDVFTRCAGRDTPEIEDVAPGSRLIQVQAGPCGPLPKDDLPGVLPQFLSGVLQRAEEAEHRAHRHSPYDVVHSHYWLSGWVGSRVKEIWGAPHVASFHTLGKVKNHAMGRGDAPEPAVRLDGEERVIRAADRILAPTPIEAHELIQRYGADPSRIRIVPPGVDPRMFAPRPKEEAKARLHLVGRLLLFVGRLQPYKGPDVAIRALAEALARAPDLTRDVVLAVVGGPTGQTSESTEVNRLMELAATIGVADRVVFFPPQPQERLADFYSAAEVVLMPSRGESFGLVALEAQACGTPVIGAAAGGLRSVILDGETGFHVEGHEPGTYADRVLRILGDPALAARLSGAAARHARQFSWDATAADIRHVYGELLSRRIA
jgi:D-inositol-3-phosphate glycosyltransferase